MTGRLPFDPTRIAAAQKRPGPEVPITVSQLAGRIGTALAVGFPASVRVIGQVSGFRERTHWYFDLKDEGAVAGCVVFASTANKLRFRPQDGQEVVVGGRVDYYAKSGKVSLIVSSIQPVGAGALELAYRALCAELRALGWFEEARKRPIPTWPRRIAIVTSKTGAALQDVLDTLRRRGAGVPVALLDVRVQGDGAAREIADGVCWLGTHRERLGVDVILLTRGGGSAEDLWAFNERVVAEAIVGCPLPVVAAIGHETDTTIAELVADLRCATPTQAAMRLTPDRDAIGEQLDALAGRLEGSARRALDQSGALAALSRDMRLTLTGRLSALSHEFERLAGRLEAHKPAALQARRHAAYESARLRLAAAMRRRLDGIDLAVPGSTLATAIGERVTGRNQDLAVLERQLGAVGPANVLKRGFTYTLLENGRLLRSPSEVAAGDRLRTHLADGEVRSVVEGKDGASPPPPARRPGPPTAKPKPGPPAPPQMDLFNPGR